MDEIFDIITNNNNIIEEVNNSDNGDAKEELIITPYMYNQNNNNGLITCDKIEKILFFVENFLLKRNIYLFFVFAYFILFFYMDI